MPPLALDVNGRDVLLADPGQARAAARRWSRMARELDTPDAPPDVKEKIRELRSRAKAATDWARLEEDRHPANPSGDEPTQPAAAASSPSPSRRRAAAALAETGIRRTRKATSTGRRGAARATRRYERAGGAPVTSLGEFAVFFVGSIVALLLLEDVLSSKGSSAFSKATTTTTGIAKRIIEPVPIITAP